MSIKTCYFCWKSFEMPTGQTCSYMQGCPVGFLLSFHALALRLGLALVDPIPHPVAVILGDQSLVKERIVEVIEPELVNDVLLLRCCPVFLGFRQWQAPPGSEYCRVFPSLFLYYGPGTMSRFSFGFLLNQNKKYRVK